MLSRTSAYGKEQKAITLTWNEDITVRCLEEEDRIQIGVPG
jgi:hypothetical protein